MRLIITRPADDAAVLKAKLEGMGHSTCVVPLLKIVPRAAVQIPSRKYQFICATSANALKYFDASDALKEIPVLTVGPQSLAAAKTAGFKSCEAHGGDVNGLADYIIKNFNPQSGPILYLSGAETSADLQVLLKAENFGVEKAVIYDAAVQTPAEISKALTTADGVLLYSPRSGRIWFDLITTSRLEKAAAVPIYFCLSENVAKTLPAHWRKSVAKTPDEAAMLVLLD
jgi:uroporphyrinogen-III synthase